MKKNIGLDLLRVWLSFEVIIDHFWHEPGLAGVPLFLSQMRSLAVPCFLLMSFYLTAHRYESCDAGWLKKRFGRLGVPYLVWPLVYFGVLWLCVALSPAFRETTLRATELKYYGFDLALDGWDLVRQWVFGMDRRLVHQFWFHHNLIVLTAGLFALFACVRRVRFRAYLLTAFVCLGLALQYSPVNVWLFGGLPWEVKYSFGRLAATLPYAALGLLVGFERGRLDGLRQGTRGFVAAVGAFLLLFVHYGNVMPRPSGLGYQGLNLLVMAFGTVALFSCLPFDRAPKWLADAVAFVSRFCMGIYCCHLLVGYAVNAWLLPLLGLRFEGLGSCAVIWLVSYGVCLVLARLPGRLVKDLVQ